MHGMRTLYNSLLRAVTGTGFTAYLVLHAHFSTTAPRRAALVSVVGPPDGDPSPQVSVTLRSDAPLRLITTVLAQAPHRRRPLRVRRPQRPSACFHNTRVALDVRRGFERRSRRGRRAVPGGGCAAAAARAAPGRLVLRRRLPRHCSALEGSGPYCCAAALGEQLLRAVARGHYADNAGYLAHCALSTPQHLLLLTDRHVLVVRHARGGGAWCALEWGAALDELLGTPALQHNRLLVTVRQNEPANYLSPDEKVIELCDEETARWAHARLACALALCAAERPCAPPPPASEPTH
ncbi:hypothetical protein EVAR_25492_1 [Eumeta japonica]|uniref:Intermembrane lipid transfer protein VPS13-like C-terminal domain-containing protein n=1 Tax=Eumeta variegata TaxID=151549 RepID=A0A4C1VKN9_EUMVA|nr:hypothetical protein EVAR_25492_1 [Eumeta japonica]